VIYIYIYIYIYMYMYIEFVIECDDCMCQVSKSLTEEGSVLQCLSLSKKKGHYIWGGYD